ncbi:HAD-IIIC family phosphatase [Clostridium boliviensis]|uniref:HAD-IIIC family phosphatase n=1 Tax=Clostridium boliviensis TaxID=318465 RepID=A0ABU4GRQ1_9CLOT|nr:HAD-IIIC family phosphatase [Clostridium boliviensis]MDW2799672.1 HAD-IIIC family phosphatase [Clostridium boliviensis]
MINSMHMIDLQKLLFEKQLRRKDLLDYTPVGGQKFKATVYRNHSFELIENTIKPYLDYAGLTVVFDYSDYDDSLSFININQDSDFLIIWLDSCRYKANLFMDFLKERLNYLKEIYKKPVLIVISGSNETIELNSQFLQVELSDIETELGIEFYDERLEKYSGTRLSSKACMLIAKKIGLHYIPILVRPNLKAIVVDLDNTLYHGVLGEDGIAGVSITDGHVKLQNNLVRLAKEGFYVCVASKNEAEDVYSLFKERTDFSLKLENLTKVCATWKAKADSINEISQSLNIGIESILFIDDNMGELAHVKEVYPDIHQIYANFDAEITAKVLDFYPGLMKTNIKHEDTIRKKDIQANDERKKLQTNYSTEDYLRALRVVITFNINDVGEIERVSELSNKTNQFIFNYKRYSSTNLKEKIHSGNYAICTVSLEDKLSDSGIVGVCVIKSDGNCGHLEEVFVSCRALGRGLDEIIVLGAVQYTLDALRIDKLETYIMIGERNLPARTFYEQYFKKFNNSSGQFRYDIPDNLITCHFKNGIFKEMNS